jgi:hypothetical protein
MSNSPQAKKHPREMTTQEAVEHLFHPKVLQHIKNEKDNAKKKPVRKA